MEDGIVLNVGSAQAQAIGGGMAGVAVMYFAIRYALRTYRKVRAYVQEWCLQEKVVTGAVALVSASLSMGCFGYAITYPTAIKVTPEIAMAPPESVRAYLEYAQKVNTQSTDKVPVWILLTLMGVSGTIALAAWMKYDNVPDDVQKRRDRAASASRPEVATVVDNVDKTKDVVKTVGRPLQPWERVPEIQ